MQNAIQPLIAELTEGSNLSRSEAARAFQIIMSGGATPVQIAAFLVALRMKGETVEEIVGGAEAMRAKVAPFTAPMDALDVCGTGGDAKGTLNVSTTAGLVLAGCGITVVKHGNRAVSSSSGSADVLEALGVRIDAERHVMERCLKEINFCFLFAPMYHKAVRHVTPVRQELGMRTVFNLLGPLANPARPSRQLVGVYDGVWVKPMAHALHHLGVQRAMVVHGADGMDELTLGGPTDVAELKDGKVRTYVLSPEDAGLDEANANAISGDNAMHNAEKLRKLLLGEKSAYRDAVLYNAAAGLMVADRVADLPQGVAMATESIDSGAANAVLQKFILMSRANA